jgi:tetratricopeptide (TPR) repeat protein
MRCLFPRVLAFSTLAVFVLAVQALGDDDYRRSAAPRSDGVLDMHGGQSYAKIRGEDADDDSDTGSRRPSGSAVADPAKQKPRTDNRYRSSTAKAAPVAKQANTPPPEDSADSTDDPQESQPVAIEATSFKGVIPGTSTQPDVAKAWGQPKKSTKVNGAAVQLYSIEPFKRVEVNYANGKVSSVVIRLDRPFPVAAVTKHLDLAAIRPAVVLNEKADVLGHAYPERGVLLAFEPSDKPGKSSMKVSQIILEPISAEPFVLRAEATLKSRPDLSRHDLEQALSLEPGNARAHWLFSRVLSGTQQRDKAVRAASEAVRLEPQDAQYLVTYAQVLAEAGQLPEAIEAARKAATASDDRPHIKARATCLVGDLLASGPNPDFRKALTLHTQAVQIADRLVADPQSAIRVAAKEVIVDAHLGAAHDVAWGDWKDKAKAVSRWLERPVAVAADLVSNEGVSEDQLFHVYTRSMAAYVGVLGGIDPSPTAQAVVATGERLLAATRDPDRKAQIQWEVGTSLYDAVQICQMRAEAAAALKHSEAAANEAAAVLKHGEVAARYMSDSLEARPNSASALLLGRLYFRMGTIMQASDHKAAVGWFERAVPLMEQASPEDMAGNLGRHGEAFASMACSYWEIRQREKAVALAQQGIQLMEQAAKQGTIERSRLELPYRNLAAMHRALGANDKAARFQEMASRIKGEKLK